MHAYEVCTLYISFVATTFSSFIAWLNEKGLRNNFIMNKLVLNVPMSLTEGLIRVEIGSNQKPITKTGLIKRLFQVTML